MLDDKTSFRLREAGFGPEESPPSSLDPARLRTVSPTVRESDLVDWLDWIWTTRNQREGRAILEVAVSDSMVPTVDRALARSSFAGEVIWLNHEGTRRGQGRGMAEGSPEAEALLRWNLGILMGQVTSTERLEEFRQRPLVTDFSQIPRLGGGSGSESPPAPRLSR